MQYLTILFCFFPFLLRAQLTAQDERLLSAVKKECALSASQIIQVDSLFTSAQYQLNEYDMEIADQQRNATDEAALATRIAVLRQKKRDIYEMRELELRLLMNDSQRRIYEEKIKPNKPAVLHYGVGHDRSTCNVCK